ncbi:hypothetical protein JCM10207_007301 [Rhodosporidiobolus poonsookiae]
MPSWQDIAAAKRADLEAKIAATGFKAPKVPPETLNVTGVSLNGVLSANELSITGSAVEEVLEKLRSGEWTSEEVVRAFCKRAVIAHELTNCLTDIYYDRALERAKALDGEMARTGKPVGPLHGLPISLKNQVNVEGEEMNFGYVGWAGRIAQKNAVIVDCLLKQGAVIYCYTNVPQALMSGETHCHLYGRTVNPHQRQLAPGGSSGGEGALIAMRGSLLGVGSDIGGSIRQPSAFNGLYGFRPSWRRLPYGDATNSMEGFEAVPSVLGPMSASLSGLRTFFKAVIDAEPWRLDPLNLHMPWNDDAYQLIEHGGGQGPLCFGFNLHNGIAKPAPPYLRAMDELKKALVGMGHKVVNYSPPDASTGVDLLFSLWVADGGEDIKRQCALSGEPVMSGALKGQEMPHLSTYDFWQLCLKRRNWIREQLRAWEATEQITGTGRPIDAIIAPAAAYPSFRHGDQQDIFYHGLSNICDYPTAVFPVTTVNPALDVKAPAHNFASDFDKHNYESYDPDVFRDVPIGLQVYARKGEDEATLKFVEICDEALKAMRLE